ncbi:M36 family metallopeptidase [Paractinoplanes globisporus]|uniref:M36 family metallopeptidase n=1 Tax=Paractinoplanes globisporus TaxID=113565 RepID=UPI001FE0E7AB|nr:M36 family metallopeptidase [Actinoplanes globisporus]
MRRTVRVLAPLVTMGLVVWGGTAAQAAPPSVPSDLQQVQVRQSLLGTHTWYQQTYRGIPVVGGYYATHKVGGKVTVDDGRKPVTGLADTTADLSAQHAKSTVAGRLGKQPGSTELVVVPGSPAKLAWMTLTPTSRGTYRSLVDAGTGAVLQEKNTVREADGTGRVFDPNPVVRLQDESLTDNDNADGPQFRRAYRIVRLTQLDRGKSTLQGAYANNISENQVSSKHRVFLFNRSQDGFEQVMAYYSITGAQEYIHRLGFRHVNNEPQDFNTVGFTDDNSFYDPSVDAITFGTGGVDDAEDNEVIWHEYGHAIQDDQVPDFGEGEEAGAIGEGFGDYWAVTMSQATSPNTKVTPWACVMDWDSTSYTTDEPHCLRRTDGPKVYPGDLDGEVHDDGEIWSHALWDVNRALGRTTANRVILESQFFFNPVITMPQAAQRTVTTALVLYGPRAAAKTRAAFHARGIL